MEIKIDTNQNVQINYEKGDIGDRILAYLIDTLLIGIMTFIVVYYFYLSLHKVFVFLIFIPLFFYHLICELLMDGQSPGKMVKELKVIKADGSNASFGNYFLRFLLRPIDSIYFIGLAFIFFTEKGQRLGDLAAATVVVSIRDRISLEDLRSIAEENNEITYPQAVKLSDKDIQLIKEILSERKNTKSHGNVIMLANKVSKILEIDISRINSQTPHYDFLKKIVMDFETHFAG